MTLNYSSSSRTTATLRRLRLSQESLAEALDLFSESPSSLLYASVCTPSGRLGRSAIAASALLATIGAPGLAQKIAAADPHNRTAPYDFGERCQSLPHDDLQHLCNPDPVAMTTGAVDRVMVLPPMVPCPFCLPQLVAESSTVGIFFDIGAPGTLTVTAAADVVGGSVCLRVASRSDCTADLDP